jgi:hypothetical protein
MQAAEILDTIQKLGIAVYINDDKLVCEPGSRLPPALKPEIRRCKSQIMALLSGPASSRTAGDGRLPPLGRPPETEMELRRLMDYLGDPAAFSLWFQRLMEQTDPAERCEDQ